MGMLPLWVGRKDVVDIIRDAVPYILEEEGKRREKKEEVINLKPEWCHYN